MRNREFLVFLCLKMLESQFETNLKLKHSILHSAILMPKAEIELAFLEFLSINLPLNYLDSCKVWQNSNLNYLQKSVLFKFLEDVKKIKNFALQILQFNFESCVFRTFSNSQVSNGIQLINFKVITRATSEDDA